MGSPDFFCLLVCSFVIIEDNIKINLKAIDWVCVDCVDVSQNRENLGSLQNTVVDLQAA
jgi:hypothetical protein